MKFGVFYEHQLPRPWGADERAPAAQGRARAGRARRPPGHRLRVGGRAPLPRGVLALVARPRSSSPPPASARSASASATASCSSRSTSTTPPASPSASPRSTWSPTAGSSSAPARRRPRPSSAASASTGRHKRDQWDEALDAVTRMFVEDAVRRLRRRVLPDAGRATSCPSRCRSPTRRCGWRAAGRETIHLAATKGIGALSFSASSSPTRPRHWVDDYYATLASEECVPGGFAVNPNLAVVLPMMCHADEETAIDRGLDGAHFFGYSPRPLLRLRQPPARAHQRVGRVPAQPRPVRLRPRASRRRPARSLGRPALRARASGRCGAPSARPTRSASLLRGYEEAGVDQVIFVSPGRAQPPRAHLRVARAVRHARSCPSSTSGEAEREKAKLERLAPAIEAALARREPAREAPDTVMKPALAF